jgi:hypothetical protein
MEEYHMHGYCYRSVNVISLAQSQGDNIKWLLLFSYELRTQILCFVDLIIRILKTIFLTQSVSTSRCSSKLKK